MTTISQKIEEVRKQLESMIHVKDLIPDADEKIAAKQRELAALEIQSQGGAVVTGTVNTGGGEFVGRDKITNIYQGAYHGLAPYDEGEALKIYLGTLLDRCGMLPLQGFTDQTSDASGGRPRLTLPGVYIQLNTKLDVSQKKLDTALACGEIRSLDELRPEQGRGEFLAREMNQGGRTLSALQAAILLRKMVLLGEPGSGKTTFINFLAYAIAARRWDDLPGWPENGRDSLPILVTLRDFAYWLALPREKPIHGVGALWAYIEHDLEMRNLLFAAPLLEAALQKGQAFLLLDGLDEVHPTEEARGAVLQITQEFCVRYGKSRAILTCRILSYDDSAWQLPAHEFPALTLASFDEQQINSFIHAWHAELSERWNQPRHELDKLETKLLGEVSRRPDLKRLAANPLLLTVMALVHTSDGELPEARALLYERAVEILLWRWDQQKGKAQGQESRVITLLREVGRDRNDLLVRLAALAYAAHQQVHDGDDAESVTGIPEDELFKEIRKLHPRQSRDWAAEVVETMKLRAGLLLERTGGAFAFPHRTFQEYLAGVHLARLTNFSEEALKCLDRGDFWRIVVLLAVGYLVHSNSDYEKPRLLIEELCPPEITDTPAAWQRAWLAGEALLELGIQRAGDTPHGTRLLRRVRERLTQLLETGHLTPRERLEAGDVLGRLGDPRFDEKRLYLPAFLRGQPEPLLGFVKIAAQKMPEFYMARYPVTNAQYRCFMEEADGYNNRAYWTPEGWAWRNGKEPGHALLAIYREEWQQKILERAHSKPNRPYWWHDSQWNAPTRPVVGVCWHEAQAYCRWLDEQLRILQPGLFLEGYTLRLPTESEWMQAASGPSTPRQGQEREWAWGNDWKKDHANTEESGLKQTSPVGMFALGQTPGTGLFDITGNIWEWSADWYEKGKYRTLRGGSWNYNSRNARCAFRYRYFPDDFNYIVGFRCVISLAISDS